MKKITFVIAILFVILSLRAQEKNFEGTVKYKLEGEKEGIMITAKMKYPFIKMYNTKNGKPINSEVTVINFDDGKIYDIDDSLKTFSKNNFIKLEQTQPALKPDGSTKVFNDSIQGIGYRLNEKDRIWYAKDYYFNIPQKYSLFLPVILFTNGKNLGLGIEISLNDADKQPTPRVTATEVVPEFLEDNIFKIPTNYKMVE